MQDYKDLVQAGIIDPAKVVRVALHDAASLAGLLVTTEAMVSGLDVCFWRIVLKKRWLK